MSTLVGTICPFIDASDSRCESKLSLDHLRDAFDLCICNYHHCPIYRQIQNERHAESTRPLIAACAQ